MAFDYSLARLSAAAGVDVKELHQQLASGNPGAIRTIGSGFRSAGSASADALKQAMDADQLVARSYVNNGQGVFDAPSSTAATRTALADGGAGFEEVARTVLDVADGLEEHTAASARALTDLEGDVNRLVAARNAFMQANGASMTVADAEAVDARFHDQAVEAVRGAGKRITAEVEAYDSLLANRAARLADFGYDIEPPRPEPEEPTDDGGFWSDAADLGADALNEAASLGNAILNNPDAVAAGALGAGAMLAGGAAMLGGGGVSLTGGGAVVGVPAAAGGAVLAAGGAATLAASVMAISDATNGADRVEPISTADRGTAGPPATRPTVTDPRLRNFVNSVYKGVDNPQRVGNGTTADAVRHEKATGGDVHGRVHTRKARETIRGLKRWLRRNPDSSPSDRVVAEAMRDDLIDALES